MKLVLLLGICLISLGSSQGPPKVTGSYRALGEHVTFIPKDDLFPKDDLTQDQFEENYDADTGDMELTTKSHGDIFEAFYNKRDSQAFVFLKRRNKTESIYCETTWTEDWDSYISRFMIGDGKFRFPLGRLLALDEKFVTETDVDSELRGIPTTRFLYEVKEETDDIRINLTVNAYWSYPSLSWNMPSSTENSDPIPLGFKVITSAKDKDNRNLYYSKEFFNVFAFLRNSVDKTIFQAQQGVVCRDRKSTIKFPVVVDLRAVSFIAEIVLPEYSEVKTVDYWFDTENKLLRLSMDRIKDTSVNDRKREKKWVSEVISGPLGAVFRVTSSKGKAECTVSSLKDYEFDTQNIINPKLKTWSLLSVFGLYDTNYVYIGKATKRNIPCSVFQGVRKDWPESSARVTSLWEWCIEMHDEKSVYTDVFRNNELLVNLEITVLESNGTSAREYPVGLKLVHHFYDVRVGDTETMDLTNFDIKYCFGKDERRDLQFAVNVNITPDNKDMIEKAMSDVEFLQKWKSQIYNATGLTRQTLRVTKLDSKVIADKLFVRFTLLGLHKDLPEEAKKDQKNLDEAKTSLKSTIDENQLLIKYMPSGKSEFMFLTATKNSLTEQVNKTPIDNLPTPSPPDPVTAPSSTEPTVSPITTVTNPSDLPSPGSSTTVVTNSNDPTTSVSSSVVTDSSDASSAVTDPSDSTISVSTSVVTDSSNSTASVSSSAVTDSSDSTASASFSVVTDSSDSTTSVSTSATTDSSGSTSSVSSSAMTASSDSSSLRSSTSGVTGSSDSTSAKSSTSGVSGSSDSSSPKSSTSGVSGSSDQTSSSSPTVTDPNTFTSTKSPEVVLSGHQPGTVAAVTILMLLVGIIIGSAGTFVNFKGLPAFFRR